MEQIFSNKELLTAVTTLAFGVVGLLIKWKSMRRQRDPAGSGETQTQEQNQSVIVNNFIPKEITKNASGAELEATNMKPSKLDIRILFVDDDTAFKVVKILKREGWTHTKIKKDVSSLDDPEVLEADILFIDVQGVGKALQFTDEGLGLVLALKRKYPLKKVVIYSAETTGDRFHTALKSADQTIRKNAEPYEFITLIEELSKE